MPSFDLEEGISIDPRVIEPGSLKEHYPRMREYEGFTLIPLFDNLIKRFLEYIKNPQLNHSISSLEESGEESDGTSSKKSIRYKLFLKGTADPVKVDMTIEMGDFNVDNNINCTATYERLWKVRKVIFEGKEGAVAKIVSSLTNFLHLQKLEDLIEKTGEELKRLDKKGIGFNEETYECYGLSSFKD